MANGSSLAMLLAMLGNWAVRGTPVINSMDGGQTIAYAFPFPSIVSEPKVHFGAWLT